MRIFLNMLLLLVAAASAGTGQWTIEGYVVDAETGLKVNRDSLELLYDGRPITVDNKGAFEIKETRAGGHLLSAKRPGYIDLNKQVILTAAGQFQFIMLSMERLHPKKEKVLVVTAPRIPLHKSAAIATDRLKTEQLGRTVGLLNDPVRGLQILPGVSTQSEAISSPTIRGGDVLETRIMLDNIPLMQPYHFGGVKSIANNSAIEELQLYKSGMPAEYPNAQSALLVLKTKRPLTNRFEMETDVSLLQYSLFTAVPVYKDRVGLALSTQGSYFNWMINQFMQLSAQATGDDFGDRFAEQVHFPDYSDYTAGLGLKITDNLSLFINELYNTDRFKIVIPDSQYHFQYYFEDTTIERSMRYSNPYEFGGAPLWDPDSGVYRYPDSAKTLSAERIIDTLAFYNSTYNLLYGTVQYLLGANQVYQLTAGWQKRTWNLNFQDVSNDYFFFDSDFLPRGWNPRYDVAMDQYHCIGSCLYSGLQNHLIAGGIQYDITVQNYNVDLPRFIHEIIINGNTNLVDYWGPISNDSGMILSEYAVFRDPEAVEQFLKNASPDIMRRFKGKHTYSLLSAYLQDEWHFNDRLIIRPGMRVESSMADSSVTVAPRLSLGYQLTQNQELTISSGLYTQNNYTVEQSAMSTDLKPEKVWHLSAEWKSRIRPRLTQTVSVYYKYYYDLIMERINVEPMSDEDLYEILIQDLYDMTYYYGNDAENLTYSDVKQLLQQVMQDNPDLYAQWVTLALLRKENYLSYYTNSGKGTAQGIEYMLEYEFTDWWHGLLSLTLSRSIRQRAPGYVTHPFPLDRPLLISFINYYRLKRKYEIALKYRYMSGLPYTDIRLTPGLYIGPFNQERYAPYMRLDLRISKAFGLLGHQCQWYTEIWNAFNAPNLFLRDRETKEIKTINYNVPFTALFMGIKFNW